MDLSDADFGVSGLRNVPQSHDPRTSNVLPKTGDLVFEMFSEDISVRLIRANENQIEQDVTCFLSCLDCSLPAWEELL